MLIELPLALRLNVLLPLPGMRVPVPRQSRYPLATQCQSASHQNVMRQSCIQTYTTCTRDIATALAEGDSVKLLSDLLALPLRYHTDPARNEGEGWRMLPLERMYLK